jgi:hypothetical protein
MAAVALLSAECRDEHAFEFQSLARVLYGHLQVVEQVLLPAVASDETKSATQSAARMVATALADALANSKHPPARERVESLCGALGMLFELEFDAVRGSQSIEESAGASAEALYQRIVGPADEFLRSVVAR